MSQASDAVREVLSLGFPWVTADPFLFCVYHRDQYPAGNAELGPKASLAGRDLGMDFTLKDGWRMYHGETVPGFPGHPHRGFETVTVVQQGRVDHADSLGAAGRYGDGDVQWLTTGKGIQHAEMFPLLHQDQENPLELFQIWLNLPRASKMAEPHFKMFWHENIPVYTSADGQTRVKLVAGGLDGLSAPTPPPASWAADPAHQVAIWVIDMAPGAHWQLPAAAADLNRMLYCFGGGLSVAGTALKPEQGARLDSAQAVELVSGDAPTRLLMLQGQPIAEPVAQYGPFVMNNKAEIMQAFNDYESTRFGGWPWDRPDPHFGPVKGRFARHADGQEESPPEVVSSHAE